jgi:protein-tyrosine phosphatase
MRRILDTNLYIGHAGDLSDLPALGNFEIEAVVELADNEKFADLPRNLLRFRFPLADGDGNPPWMLRMAAETVGTLHRSGVHTLVCCSAGMSRSLCVTAAAIALGSDVSLVEAMAKVAASGPCDVSPALFAAFQTALGE